MISTIMVDQSDVIGVGSRVVFTLPDTRWWKRLLHFLSFQKPPTIRVAYDVVSTVVSADYSIINIATIDAV